jgi:hypothetical protein
MSAFRKDHSRTNRRGDDGLAGFQSIQKMLARELCMQVPGDVPAPELRSDS